MAQWQGLVHGKGGATTRLGSVKSGLVVQANSWQGRVEVVCWTESDGRDMVAVRLGQHVNGEGCSPARDLYTGPISGQDGSSDASV